MQRNYNLYSTYAGILMSKMSNQSKSITLAIVRHGQTEANVKKIIHGWTDAPLNDAGINQAKAAGKALKGLRLAHLYFFKFYT